MKVWEWNDSQTNNKTPEEEEILNFSNHAIEDTHR